MLHFLLKKKRQEKLLSQEKLSALTGLSQGYISQLESGTKEPTIHTINKIAEILEICPLELLDCSCEKCSKGR